MFNIAQTLCQPSEINAQHLRDLQQLIHRRHRCAVFPSCELRMGHTQVARALAHRHPAVGSTGKTQTVPEVKDRNACVVDPVGHGPHRTPICANVHRSGQCFHRVTFTLPCDKHADGVTMSPTRSNVTYIGPEPPAPRGGPRTAATVGGLAPLDITERSNTMLLNASVGDLTRIDATVADSLFTPIAVQVGPIHLDLPFEQALRLRDELTRVIDAYSQVPRKPKHGPVAKQSFDLDRDNPAWSELFEEAWRGLFKDGDR